MNDRSRETTRDGSRAVYRERIRIDSELLKAHPPSLFIDDERVPMLDISMGGCLARDTAEQPPLVGTTVRFRVELGQTVYYEGEARVARVERGEHSRIGYEVATGFIDVPKMLDQHDKLVLQAAVAGYRRGRELLPADYRHAIEALSDFERYHRRVFSPREKMLVEEGARSDQAIAELTGYAYEQMRPLWLELRDAAAAAARPYYTEKPVWRAMKALTERQLTHQVLGAPLIERAYHKPLGYAGDFRTMTFVYRNALEGPTVVDRVFHKFVAREPLAEGVRCRKDLMKEITLREHERVRRERGEQSTTRVMSLGCGPALEVRELAEDPTWPGRINWTLVDQESRALSLAYTDNFPAIRGVHGRGDIRCLNIHLRDLGKGLLPLEDRDLIYAAGLFDYLKKDTARALIALLADNLAPGGLVAIGNARVDEKHFWVPEFLLDWTLLYRTDKEMRELANHLGPEFTVELTLEPAEAYWFLLVRRSA